MKRNSLLKTFFLLCALIVGSTNAWADKTDTYTFDSKSWGAVLNGNPANWTSGKDGNQITSGQGIQVSKSVTGANGTSPVSYTNVKQVVVRYCTNASNGRGTISVKVGNGTAQNFEVTKPAAGTGTTLKDATFNFNPTETGKVTITVTCTDNSLYINSAAITTTEDSGDPSISATDVDLVFDATSGEFGYTINNAVDGAVLAASSTDDWISNVAVNTETSKVTFNTTANPNASSREGKITLTYKKGDDVLTTKDVTITQAKAVLMVTYNLASSVVPGRHYIITNGSNAAMGADRGNNRGQVDVTITGGSTTFSSDAGVCELLIGLDEETGFYTLYDAKTGYLCAASNSSNNLKYQATPDANGKWIIAFNADGDAHIQAQGSYTRDLIRYNSGNNPPIFSCYADATKQNPVYLYEKADDTGSQDFTVTIAAACTDGEKYYGTYSRPFAFTVPNDVIVEEVMITDEKINRTAYAPGAVIPANTGVLISSNTAGDKTFTSAKGGISVLGDNNNLKPTYWGLEDEDMDQANIVFYRLTMHNGTTIGFWYGAANGAAFDIAANKAYLAVPGAASAKISGFAFDGTTTGINALDNSTNSQLDKAPIYNLAGQRVTKAYKGVVIQNGKKLLNK